MQGDTDRGTGFGSAGSRSLFTGGSAVQVAGERTVDDRAKQLAADALEVADRRHRVPRRPLRRGGHRPSASTCSSWPRSSRSGASLWIVDHRSPAPAGRTAAMSARWRSTPTPVDVEIVAYASVNDVGRVVNPMIVVGQLEGGARAGLGQALCEQVVYDPESGQLLTASFMDYAMPRADMVAGPIRTCSTSRSRARPTRWASRAWANSARSARRRRLVNAVARCADPRRTGEPARGLQMPLTPTGSGRCCTGEQASPARRKDSRGEGLAGTQSLR